MDTHLARFNHNGFEYSYKDTHGERFRYRCIHYRTGCSATVAISRFNGDIYVVRNQHSCTSAVATNTSETVDLTEDVMQRARDMACIKQGVSALQIWAIVVREVDEMHQGTPVVKPLKSRVIAEVLRVRREFGSGDAVEKARTPEYQTVSMSDKRRFLQTALHYNLPSDGIDDELRTILIWSHPELLVMLRRQRLRLLIDCTFACVPRPFMQCMIVMLYDDETDIFVPVVYSLLDTKAQWAYWHVLHFLLVLTETKLAPFRSLQILR